MKKAKAPRVPVLENAFEVSLPKLIRAAKSTGSSRLALDDGNVRTVAVLAETRLAVFLGGQQWVVDIVPVQCLQGRSRPLLKCPRAHEGNFQSLYFRGGELACRHCHALRYRSNVAATAIERARIARSKLLLSLGAEPGHLDVLRQSYKHRKRHLRIVANVVRLTNIHYNAIHSWLDRRCK
jgi:hypothetical protein